MNTISGGMRVGYRSGNGAGVSTEVGPLLNMSGDLLARDTNAKCSV